MILVTGIFPEDLKQSRLTLILKDGYKSECGNYRLISVISIIAKVLEMLISDQLALYLNDSNIIVKQQSGFRKWHSIETTLLHMTDQYLLNMEIFERLRWEPIENILKKREIIMTFKGHSRRAPRVHVRNV